MFVQTFLPDSSFETSAKILDYRRLGKQRVETLQLLKALFGETKGWANHPAAKMWQGHTNALVLYGIAMCNEWIERGYKDSCLEKIQSYWRDDLMADFPSWMNNEGFFASHRSNLLRKNPDYYSNFGWNEPNTLPYIWPGDLQPSAILVHNNSSSASNV